MKEIIYHKYLDDEQHELIRFRIWTDKGKLVSLVVQYESFILGKWHNIVRYDCSHGFFHRDVLFPKGVKEKYEISITSLKDGFNYAEQDIKDRWEFYKERYVKQLKK